MKTNIVFSIIIALVFGSSAFAQSKAESLLTFNNLGDVKNKIETKVETNKNSTLSSIVLPNNGLIWSTEDSSKVTPSLQIASLSYIGYDGKNIIAPIDFYVRTNYAAFIEKMEIIIYRGIDQDLIEPIATLPIQPSGFTKVSWDGNLSGKYNYKVGDKLTYVVRAYDKDGRFDETVQYKIQLIKPEDEKTSKDKIKDSISKEQGVAFDVNAAISQLLLNNVFFGNGLEKQNIPVYGSTITIRGINLPSSRLLINNEQFPVDFERKFEAEYIVPSGTHFYDIYVYNDKPIVETLRIDVASYYFFGMAIADFTLSKARVTGAGKTSLIGEDANDYFRDGRLAFYLKSKIKNRFTITAQADTTEKDIKKMFNGFTKANADDIFESLDPEMYYPTYGDDSTTFRDIDTQGKFYVRADWDKSHALWGNYNTGFTGTRYAQYSRSLYGGALDWRSIDNNAWGDAKTLVKGFVSEANSVSGHTELLGTGGSLYYLKHANIIEGSDKVILQITELSTGKILANVELMRNADYEIDNIQGRIILSRPLSQITRQSVTSITTTTPLSGYEQRLIVDYEWEPSEFNDNLVTGGVRAKHWFGDHLALGGTYVREGQDGNDYEILGTDITLQAGKGTYLKGEYTHTKSSGAQIYYSDNGGLSFAPLGSSANDRDGDAFAIDTKVNFKELNVTDNELSIASWWRKTNSGYATSRSYLGSEITEYGAELIAELIHDWKVYSQISRAERDNNEYTEAQLTSKYQITDKAAISIEVKHIDTKTDTEKSKGTLGALRLDYDITPYFEAYATGQLTLDNDGGNYKNNDAVILGTRYLFTDSSSISAEYTTGHRGDALQIDASYQLNPDHSIYGGYTWANGYSSDFDTVFNANKNSGWTLGQRWNLSDQVTLFNESQMIREKGERGATNSVGMDFYLGEGWNLGIMYQKGELNAITSSGDVDRDAFSFSVGRTASDINWLSKIEYRKDKGAEQREQWVTTNRITYKVNESLRLAGKFNFSDTDDELNSNNGARFIESNIGFAYRPFDSTKWGLFGRYTYMYDLSTIGQVNGVDYDQKSHVFSLEGVYKHNEKWEFALKVAERLGYVRYGRGTGSWFDSRTTFAAAQARYDVLAKWHALVEYRVLDIKDGGMKQGFMIGLDRDITDNFRIGAGYNFTDFSDDLTKFDYKYRGWYLNVVGTY